MHSRHMNGVTKLQTARSPLNVLPASLYQTHIYQLSPDVPDDLHPLVHIQISCLGRKHCTSLPRSERVVKTETFHRLCYIQAQTFSACRQQAMLRPKLRTTPFRNGHEGRCTAPFR